MISELLDEINVSERPPMNSYTIDFSLLGYSDYSSGYPDYSGDSSCSSGSSSDIDLFFEHVPNGTEKNFPSLDFWDLSYKVTCQLLSFFLPFRESNLASCSIFWKCSA
ncbi:hypothetical protein AVEN_5281-1 [Araneus ventricosus]|uniref:Uncharacterized protein n=1 Tax=Araneus ventricosus TaxID=182803 RepID=A0A4Y2CX91_ARAVE|nr:hypothetical protein AVEN_5281-1 [Araneus ventricosus]